MISGAAQQHKKRLVPLRKTDDMRRADRKNGRILDEIWKNGKDCYQVGRRRDEKRAFSLSFHEK